MPQIKLSTYAGYRYGGKQWIARIRGRDPVTGQLCREFISQRSGNRGAVTEATLYEPGIYETCDVDSQGKARYAFLHFAGNTYRWVSRDWVEKKIDTGP